MRPITRPLRWGIVATGGMAATFADDLRRVPEDAELALVVSRTMAKASAFAERFAIPHAADSLNALSDVDVVYVATPHSDHAGTTAALLSAGKHVLCEKPLTTTPAETEALFQAAQASGTLLMEAVWMRCNPLIRLATDLVKTGTLGHVRTVHAAFTCAADFADDHRMLDPRLGGGAILDLGVYPAHLIEAILGRPASVYARGSLARTGVDATSTAVFNYPATTTRPQATGVAFTSIEADADQRAEIVGTMGRLVIDSFLRPTSMTLTTRDGENKEYVASLPGAGYTFEAQEVARCVRAGLTQSPLISWDSTRNASAMMAAWRTALEHRDGLVQVER